MIKIIVLSNESSWDVVDDCHTYDITEDQLRRLCDGEALDSVIEEED